MEQMLVSRLRAPRGIRLAGLQHPDAPLDRQPRPGALQLLKDGRLQRHQYVGWKQAEAEDNWSEWQHYEVPLLPPTHRTKECTFQNKPHSILLHYYLWASLVGPGFSDFSLMAAWFLYITLFVLSAVIENWTKIWSRCPVDCGGSNACPRPLRTSLAEKTGKALIFLPFDKLVWSPFVCLWWLEIQQLMTEYRRGQTFSRHCVWIKVQVSIVCIWGSHQSISLQSSLHRGDLEYEPSVLRRHVTALLPHKESQPAVQLVGPKTSSPSPGTFFPPRFDLGLCFWYSDKEGVSGCGNWRHMK